MFFDGPVPDSNAGAVRLPTIAVGMDVNDLADVTVRHVLKTMSTMERGEHPGTDASVVDSLAINADLARLPTEPDESLQ
jgi:hypothetical protein